MEFAETAGVVEKNEFKTWKKESRECEDIKLRTIRGFWFVY